MMVGRLVHTFGSRITFLLYVFTIWWLASSRMFCERWYITYNNHSPHRCSTNVPHQIEGYEIANTSDCGWLSHKELTVEVED